MRSNSHLYEVNAHIFLRRVSEKYGRKLTLATIPDDEWQFIARRGFDLIWLMGVWQRTAGARLKALCNTDLRRKYDNVLPDWRDDDIAGSTYAIQSHILSKSLGEESDLARVKAKLNNNGLGIFLDFVPNHLALDNPWALSHPDWFVQGSKSAVRKHPDWFFSPDGKTYLAHGRDPYFPS
jgi:hypothetical protein